MLIRRRVRNGTFLARRRSKCGARQQAFWKFSPYLQPLNKTHDLSVNRISGSSSLAYGEVYTRGDDRDADSKLRLPFFIEETGDKQHAPSIGAPRVLDQFNRTSVVRLGTKRYGLLSNVFNQTNSAMIGNGSC